MTEKFETLDEEKRERIINAALREFALRGYEKASTNEIVKAAGISKGLLFHYFKSKKQLFLYLYDFVMGIMQEEFNSKTDFNEHDLFRKMRQISGVKLSLQRRYPELFDFTLGAYLESSPQIREELQRRNLALLSFNMGKLFQDIDTSRLKEEIELQEVLNIVSWTIEGMVNDEIKKCRLLKQELDFDKLFSLADVYFDKFEKLFYKEVN